MLEIEPDLIRHIVNHAFLPKKLPGDEFPDLDTLHHALISIVSEVVSNSNADFKMTKTTKMFQTWKDIHYPADVKCPDKQPLQHAINNMQNGDMIAMYFKSQNAGLILSKNSESVNNLTAAAFQASCNSGMIMSSPANLLVDYPEICAKMSTTKLLESSYFAKFLQYLMQNPAEIAYEKSPKAGQSHNEYREVVDPMLITDFIISVLCNKDSETDLNFPRVQKKVRDDVVLGKGSLPFRRTGFWMTVKVALQLSLMREQGMHEQGQWFAKIAYKCIMLKTLQDILCKFHERFSTGDWDIKMQMMAKIAIRFEKIKKMLAKYEERYGKINLEFVLKMECEVVNQLSEIRSVLDLQWQGVSKGNIVEHTSLSFGNFEEDTKQNIPLLEKTIEQRKKLLRNANMAFMAFKPELPLCPKRLDFSKFPALSILFKDQSHVTDIELCEVENWIRYSLDKFAITANCDHIKTIAFKYSTTAFKHYKDDPNAYSKFVLVNLKLLQVLDEIAIKEFPLLKKHKCGVKLSFIDSLLLRTRSEMQWAQQLATYFTQRDKESDQLPSLIEESQPSKNSFAVKFAQRSPEMLELRCKILNDARLAISNKLDEVRQAKNDCDKYRCKIRNNNFCQYTYQYNTYYERNDKIHCWPCVKCSTEVKLNARLTSVKPYERPLSSIDFNQYAVVFEMLLPNSIGCLRDVLHFFHNDVVEYAGLNCKSDDIITKWVDYDGLSKYPKNMVASTNVKLVSSSKPTIVTHYKRSLTVDEDEDNFINNNGLNHLYRGQVTLDQKQSGGLGSKCIYKISHAYAVQYGGMQWAIDSTSHTSNQVLARQSECPKMLPSADFVQFGSLRAGHLLQYRNIVVSLTNGKLQLKNEPVFSLLCQAMWQAGSQDEDKWYRNNHADLLDYPFTNELIKLVERLVDSSEKLWSDPFALCCLIAIVSRTLELTESEKMRNKCSELLRKCRTFATAWIDVTEELIGKALNASEEDKNTLKLKKVMATLAVSLSFSVSPEFLGLVMNDENDVFMWLMAISTLQNELLWNEQRQIQELKISAIQRSLLRLTMITSVMLEPQIRRYLGNDNCVLSRFSQKRWLRADDVKTWKWAMCTVPYKQVYQCTAAKSNTGSEHVIYIDALLGKFLVDGCPIGKLPEQITRHPEYLRVFERAEFQVQPDRQGSFEVYTTTVKYHNRRYSFQLRNETLIIQETQDDKKSSLELIPHKTLDSRLPDAFQEKYSHWWDCNDMVILFRLKDFKLTEFADTIFFTLDLKSFELTKKGKQRLLRMDSSTVTHLTRDLVNVESKRYIHIWKNIKDDNSTFLSVDLTVLGLKFIIDTDGALKSREFPGMQVDSDQSIESLVGLKNKLVLVGSVCRNVYRKVIIPNGTVRIHEDTSRNHQSTSINLTSLGNPKFFTYEKDDRLRTFVAGRNQVAWLFLAALHGATSSPLPDIFTGVTGTEMAFRILQSARVWSHKPYDNESFNIFKTLNSFVPERSYYPHHRKVLQKIVWPIGLPPTAAHEGFLLIINKLIEDSHKLDCIDISTDNDHKSDANKNVLEKCTCDLLNLRHYWRQNKYLNDLMSISDEFLKLSPPEDIPFLRHTLLTNAEDKIKNLRVIAHLCHSQESVYYSWMKRFVTNMLITGIPLKGAAKDDKNDPLSIETWFNCKSKLSLNRDNWLQLYCYAVNKAQTRKSHWQMLLSAMVIQGIDINYIYILQLIAVHASTFNVIIPPEYPIYDCPIDKFHEKSIKQCIENSSIGFSKVCDTHSETLKAQSQYNAQVKQEVDEITDFVDEEWYICGPVSSVSISRTYSKISVDSAETKVNELLKKWYKNVQLCEFLERFEQALAKIVDKNLGKPNIEINKLVAMNACKRVMPMDSLQKDLVSLLNENDIEEDEEAKEIYDNSQAPMFSKHETSQNHLAALEILQRKSTKMLDDFKCKFTNDKMGLEAAGLLPRFVPQTLLPVLLLDTSTRKIENVQNQIGAICVLWTLEQKIIRCINYSNAGRSMEVLLAREKETEGKRFWVPKDYPGWLLLELELNMMIRPIQIKVAREMMSPTSGKNSVMQLNMGEGKTALIVPMLAVVLSNKKQICRVTVIKSIFETNFNSLRHTLGGVLNRRVYSFPCRRDVTFSIEGTLSILSSYQECMEKQGLVVTLPEYRLSFQLKGYEIASKNDNAVIAQRLLCIQEWLNENTRDILDESDEILTVKYQLIYTMGFQDIYDGGDLRWTICQKILKRLPDKILQLQKKFGDSAIEYDKNFIDNPAIFPHCRLLKTDVYQELIELLADDFIQGEIIGFASLTKREIALVKRFLVDNDIAIAEVEETKALFSDNNRYWQIVLIMAGYLRFRLLEVALVKRWRVNYGVNTKNKFRDMAVPFRAKDVASERTEFGHPDMAIALTQLSYYYSGLNDQQILQCFAILQKSDQLNPSNEYASWISNIPPENIHPSVQRYDGINLEDFEQRTTHLFPMLRKTTRIIDFWLSHLVFPKECKQFPAKMTCTAWDLCSENKRLLTTGFSGTNDSQRLLPLPISQNDLQELQDTNKKLEMVLLARENDDYKALPIGIKSIEILQRLMKDGIKILLDCGALMLELNNEEVAATWLNIDKNIEAVIFFNKKNVLTVKTRGGKDYDFELSPFRDMMDKCGVYLDDEHTRGTDLKFPTESRACVTLGSGLTRDKMVQACMRMRMLESKKHTLSFWASHEVNEKIKALTKCRGRCTSADVLEWVKWNSKQFEEDGLIYWTLAGVNYCRKRGAEKEFRDLENNLQKFGKDCTEPEVTKLDSMYGHSREMQKFVEIVPRWFGSACKSLSLPLSDEIFVKTRYQVLDRLNKIIPEKTFYSQLLEEEQEKELEFELELEIDRELPGIATAQPHRLTIFKSLSAGRILSEEDSDILPICHVFKGTSLWPIIQKDCWGFDVFASTDFITVVKVWLANKKTNYFIRPVTWVVEMKFTNQLLLISPFEANHLIRKFKEGEFKCTLHLYTPRYLPKQEILLRNSGLCVPSHLVEDEMINDRIDDNKTVSPWDELLAPLSLCAGNLYFQTETEQRAFANFLALIPKPRDEILEAAFNEGLISKINGFVDQKHRGHGTIPKNILMSAFHTNPQELVEKILQIRHEGVFPVDSDVGKLILYGMKTFL